MLKMLNTTAENYFILCESTRPDMLPTGYYDPSSKLVDDKEDAAKFRDLDEVLKFVEDHQIRLGESCFIGGFVKDN